MNEQTNASREYKIRVFPQHSETIVYIGKYYILFNDKDGCFHFIDENGKHHRFYNATVIVDEI